VIQSCYFICPYEWWRRRWWRQCVHGNVGGGVFSLLGDTIIFRLKLLLLRKPCPSPLSTTSHTANRVCSEQILSYPCECVCRWREKKKRARTPPPPCASFVRRRCCPRAPYVGGGELRKPWTTGGLGASERGFYSVSLAASVPLTFRLSRARARSFACQPGRPPAPPRPVPTVRAHINVLCSAAHGF